MKLELEPEPAKKFKWSFEFLDPGSLDHPIVIIDDASFSYTSETYTNNLLIKNINGRVETNTRICIMGAKGTGKSTLLKLILETDELKISLGKISLNPHSRIYHHLNIL